MATFISGLLGAPVPDHVVELFHRGRLADNSRMVELLGFTPAAATVDVVDKLYAWPSVIHRPPRSAAASERVFERANHQHSLRLIGAPPPRVARRIASGCTASGCTMSESRHDATVINLPVPRAAESGSWRVDDWGRDARRPPLGEPRTPGLEDRDRRRAAGSPASRGALIVVSARRYASRPSSPPSRSARRPADRSDSSVVPTSHRSGRCCAGSAGCSTARTRSPARSGAARWS